MRDGLTRVSLLPVRSGYLEAQAGALTRVGLFVRAEAGYRASSNLNLFGFGQWSQSESMAGAGVRVTF